MKSKKKRVQVFIITDDSGHPRDFSDCGWFVHTSREAILEFFDNEPDGQIIEAWVEYETLPKVKTERRRRNETQSEFKLRMSQG